MDPLPALPSSLASLPLPALVVRAGARTSRRFVEFFAATLRNRNTRAAYWHACTSFLRHCEALGVPKFDV